MPGDIDIVFNDGSRVGYRKVTNEFIKSTFNNHIHRDDVSVIYVWKKDE